MINKLFNIFKPKISVVPNQPSFPLDFSDFENEIIEKVLPFTMTSPERLYNLIKSVEYIINNKINGDFVECGIWKGGSVMAMVYTLLKLGVTNRKIYLYDTFEGMPPATEYDQSIVGEDASKLMSQTQRSEQDHLWAYAPLEKVKENLKLTNYPFDNFIFIKGKVEETINTQKPLDISILRLDTDWYESTKFELNHLYPLLTQGGVLFIDDYGHWKGSKKATDEYIEENKLVLYLTRIDYTCRVAVKIK